MRIEDGREDLYPVTSSEGHFLNQTPEALSGTELCGKCLVSPIQL